MSPLFDEEKINSKIDVETMKAAFLYTDRARHMGIEDVPRPSCGPNDVLVKVKACAICGTDGRMYEGTKDVTKGFVPQIRGYGEDKFIIGHEIVGTVEEVGSRVRDPEYEMGNKVVLVTSVGCGKKGCRACGEGKHNMCKNNRPVGYYYPGGFAEYILVQDAAVEQGAIIAVPEDCPVSDEHLAMVEPLSCVINGQEYLKIKEEEYVTVVGAGPIGLMHCLLARTKGARIILAERSLPRLARAKEFGFEHSIATPDTDLVGAVLDLTNGEGTDVGIVACSVKEIAEHLSKAMAMRGRLSLFAGFPKENPILRFDGNNIHYREISIHGAFASDRAQFEEALKLVVDREVPVDRLVTHTFPLGKIVEAMERTLNKDEGALRVVVKP